MTDFPFTSDRVWRRLGETLRRYLTGRVRDGHLAEDLLQEVFLRIHRGLGTLADGDRLAPWVFRIANNVVADHWRKSKADPVPRSDGWDRVEGGEEGGPAVGANSDLRSVAECLCSMIESLPPLYRDVVRLSEIEGLPHREIAEKLDLSVSGVKSRVQRGRDQLKGLFLDCCRIEFDHQGRPIDCEARGQCEEGDDRPDSGSRQEGPSGAC